VELPNDLLQEHTLALLSRLDLLIRRAVVRARLQRGQRPDEDYRGLYVSEGEVEAMLSDTPNTVDVSPDFDAALKLADGRIAKLDARCRTTGQVPRVERLAELFDLSPFEKDVVLVCLAAEVDLKYERLFAYLQDDVTKKRPTVNLVFRLLGLLPSECAAGRGSFEAGAPLVRWELVGVHDDPSARRPVLLARHLKLDERIAGYLLGSAAPDPRLGSLDAYATCETTHLPARVRDHLGTWSRTWPWRSASRPPVILLHGRYGNGQTAAAAYLAESLGHPLLVFEARTAAPTELPLERRLMLAEREALLSDALLCWSGVDLLLRPEPGQDGDFRTFTRALAHGRTLTVLLADRAWEPGPLLQQRPFVRLELPDTTYAERRELWTTGLNGSRALSDDDVTALASRFRLSPGQIQDAIARAHTLAWTRDPGNGHISSDDVDAACRVQAQHHLGALARKLVPRYSWTDIVLPPAQMTTLRLIATMIRQRTVVYGEWGFDRKLAMGKGVMALFAGPSGTGKTMAAEILAHELGLDLFRIDLSSVVNKYIGETEKNLERLFSEAQDSDAILFFDEADALFGKRSGVSDAHDRYANIETAYLLQRTEEYNGLVILASNLPRNMDDAFVRRIHFTINFPAPEETERLELWKRTFPIEAPRADDLDLEFLARQLKITGGNIRNIVLASAFLAADEAQPISMRHLIRASAYEFQKMGKMLLESDFGQYFDLAR
jgi:ATPase family associated with various cellular activities (AAA)